MTDIAARRGRKRAVESLDAAGELSLLILARDGEAEPDNVVRMKPLPPPTPMQRSPETLLLIFLWMELAPERRQSILARLRLQAFEARCPDALALYELLKERTA